MDIEYFPHALKKHGYELSTLVIVPNGDKRLINDKLFGLSFDIAYRINDKIHFQNAVYAQFTVLYSNSNVSLISL